MLGWFYPSGYIPSGSVDFQVKELPRVHCEYCNSSGDSQNWNYETKRMDTQKDGCPVCMGKREANVS